MFLVKNKKSPVYQVVYFVNGKRTTKSTGTTNRIKAEVFLEIFKTSNNATDVIQNDPLVSAEIHEINLSAFQSEYLSYLIPIKSENYTRSVDLSFRQFINYVGDIYLSQVNTKCIDQFITNTFARTKRGAHLYYRTLKATFSKAVSWNYIEANPFQKVKFPRLQKNYPLFITLEEFDIILANTKEEYLKDFFRIAFYTGMRIGEIVNLKWSWVNLDEKVIYVRCSESFQTKSKKERIIPIKDTLISVILNRNNLNNSNEYLFTNEKGSKLREEFVSKKFKSYVRLCGMSDLIHFHSLRHSFASRLVQKGVPLEVIQELLGHEDLKTTQIYSHLQQQNLREAINLF